MNFIRSKIVIVGAGNVGVTTAFNLVAQGICDEIALIDLNEEKMLGEVMDLTHCMEYLHRNVSVKAGTYDDCKDADIVIITASAPMKSDLNDRMDLLGKAKAIMKSIVDSVMASGFDGHLIVVSNPVDIMTYYAYKLSGLPANQVIGSGTSLDTARLKCIIGEKINVDPKSINALVIGEHGESEIIPWSCCTVGGKDLLHVIEDNPSRMGNESLEEMRHRTIQAGWDIFHRKGNTSYGIAASVVGIVRSILFNENEIIPVSTLLTGQYGESDVYIGVPTILNREGAREVVELHMTDEELKDFKEACARMRSYYEELQIN